VPLCDLEYFARPHISEDPDLKIRVDRQGTPTRLSGGISYDEHLGRFGFGLTVVPGPYTQIVVSPLLERSPEFLFTNVIEPIMRWRFVQLGYTLVRGAAVASDSAATILCAEQDMAPVVSELCRTFAYGFMADDLTLLSASGEAYCYPKPVTVSQAMLRGTRSRPGISERLSLRGQQLLYTRFVRRIGLWLSEQDLPAASFSTYIQRLVPQPKRQWADVFPEIDIVARATLATVAFAPGDSSYLVATRLAQSVPAASFQPHPLLAERLRFWDGVDLIGREQEIITSALANVTILPLERDGAWWKALGLAIESTAESPHDTLEAKGQPSRENELEPQGSPRTL